MRDSGFLEDITHGLKALLQVEAFSGQLRVKHCAMKAALACLFHQKFEYRPPEIAAAHLSEHRHSSNFDFVVTMRHESSASHWAVFDKSDRVERTLIVFVKFYFLRYALFVDKHDSTNRIGLSHLLGSLDRDDVRSLIHTTPNIAQNQARSNRLPRIFERMLGSRHSGGFG